MYKINFVKLKQVFLKTKVQDEMYWYIFLLSFLVNLTTAFVNKNVVKDKLTDHEFVNSPSLIRHSDEVFQLNTKAFGQDYSINLKKSSNIFHDDFQLLSMEMGNDNQFTLKTLNKNIPETQIFKDEVHGSVVHISDDNGVLKAEGMLTPDLSFVPHSDVQHKIVKSKPNDQYKKISNSFSKFATSFATSKVKREIPEIVYPELLVVVDYKHASILQFSSDRIMKYLAVFWNAVNLRFATLTEPKIELRVVGAIIIKESTLQPYMEKGRFVTKGSRWSRSMVYIDFMESLPSLAQELFNKSENYPKHDLLMVMTGEDLATKDDDGSVDSTYTGIAIVGGACTIDKENNMTLSVGIAEDTPPFYEGVLYHAHEVAHLLGAVHDGDEPAEHLPGSPGAEACPFKDGYLMSYKLSTINKTRWSQCTVDQIRWYIGTAQAECLLSRENKKWPLQLNKTYPGTLVDADHQCNYAGRNARAYPNQDKSSVCIALYCSSDTEKATTKGPALEGTPCGYIGNRWCINGECVRKEP